MDTDVWIQYFRSKVLNTTVNCFDELIQYSSSVEPSYPNLLMMKILWPDQMYEKYVKFNFNSSLIKCTKWMNEMPSFWNELRYMTHCGIQQIIRNKKCSDIIIAALKSDGEKLQESDFKTYWNEIVQVLNYQPILSDKTTVPKFDPNNMKINKNQNYLSTYQHQKKKKKKTQTTQDGNEMNKAKKKPTIENHLKDQPSLENYLLWNNKAENEWKNQTIEDQLQKLKRKFNKLNFAYLFLRNYNIFNLSELIRKNLQIECSRPSKFNYYNILISDRIYQENQKLVKGIIRQYKYKRRTRAMSVDDNDNTIWIPNYKKKTSDEEYKIKNDRINILCEVKTAIVNNNYKEILRLSIDKRIKLVSVLELEKLGYFKIIHKIEGKENNTKKEAINDKKKKDEKLK